MRQIAFLLGLLLLAGTLAACGRMGPVRPPGPAEEVTWPRVYPSR